MLDTGQRGVLRSPVTLEFRILGPLEVSTETGHVALGGPSSAALLAILLLEAGRVVPTDRLVDLLWGEEAPKNRDDVAPERSLAPAQGARARRPRDARARLRAPRRPRADRCAPLRAGTVGTRVGLGRGAAGEPGAARSSSGAGRRSPSSRSRSSRRPRSAGSRSYGSSRSRSGSRPTSSSAGTATSIGELEALVARAPAARDASAGS